jgi:thioredoxin-like negative regulator of GroEL
MIPPSGWALIVFSAKWCSVCPLWLAALERAALPVPLVILDVEDHTDLATRYCVSSVPTTALFLDGVYHSLVVSGTCPIARLTQRVNEIVQNHR